MQNYIIHVQKHDIYGKTRYAISVGDKPDVLDVIMMLEKNSQVKEYQITLVHDFGMIPIQSLMHEFNFGLISEKFLGITNVSSVPSEKKKLVGTEYWRYTNPITLESIDYRFSEPLNKRQAVHLLMLVEPKFIASVVPEKINDFLLSLVDPWISNEALDIFDIKEWKNELGLK